LAEAVPIVQSSNLIGAACATTGVEVAETIGLAVAAGSAIDCAGLAQPIRPLAINPTAMKVNKCFMVNLA
jgi:hypothetical protein